MPISTQNICTDTPRLCNYASFLTGSVAMVRTQACNWSVLLLSGSADSLTAHSHHALRPVAQGVVVIPIFGVISCFAFCCARCSRNKCRCCCRACGQPNCFGRYPMREYKWCDPAFLLPPLCLAKLCVTFLVCRFESLPTLLLLLLSITIVLAFCLGGMLAVYEVLVRASICVEEAS